MPVLHQDTISAAQGRAGSVLTLIETEPARAPVGEQAAVGLLCHHLFIRHHRACCYELHHLAAVNV